MTVVLMFQFSTWLVDRLKSCTMRWNATYKSESGLHVTSEPFRVFVELASDPDGWQ